MADVTMPQLGETVTEGTITKWFKGVGDKIEADEPLFEVSTDKVDSEVPSPAAGYLAEIVVEEGETVDVGVKLAVITSDEPAEASAAESGNQASAAESGTSGSESGGGNGQARADVQDAQEKSAEAAERPEVEQESARPEGAEAEAELARAQRQPDGDGQADTKPAPEAPSPAAQQTGAARPAPGTEDGGDGGGAGAGGKVLSPVVRRLIKEHDLDPSQIEGTGAGGRITRADVLAFIDKSQQQGGSGGGTPAEAQKAAVGSGPDLQPPSTSAGSRPDVRPAQSREPQRGRPTADDELVPFSNIRRRTAEHMVRSKATSAHVLTAIEADFDGVERARGAAKEQFRAEEGFALTYLPFVARAVIDAIRDFPHVNASVGDNELIVHHRIHLAIAVDLSFEGLIAPVIHDADGKRLRAIAREVSDLAARARNRKLSADEIAGGTFTITNPGGYGTLITAPIINQPQVAILSTDGVRKRPVAVELDDGSDAIAVHPVGMLALSFDHRAFDGAYASAFIARIKEIIETRDWASELT